MAPARKQSTCASRVSERRPAESRTRDCGISDARGRHHAHEVERIDRRAVLQRRAWHGDKRVDRHALGMRIEIGECLQQPGAVLDAFAHADDAAAADLDACAPHALERIQPVLIAARGDDLAVELSRGVEIVVVGGEPSLGQPVGLGLS